MRSPNKSRSRNKNQNRRSSSGNVINRVFDSSGPEGKVRGTPQQIIDKYQMLARDAQLSGDRVAAENFLQHSEHYARILNEAQREQTQKREQYEAQQAQQAQRRESQEQAQMQPRGGQEKKPADRETAATANEALGVQDSGESGLVETPEGKSGNAKSRKPRSQKAPKPEASESEAGQAAQ